MKKILSTVIIILLTLFTTTLFAQTNIQGMYDFNREQITVTYEHFNTDSWGSNFFFVDMYNKFDTTSPTDFYTEISRSFNFWKNTPIKDLSVHTEYNGGFGIFKTDSGYGAYTVNNAFLVGLDYFLHSKDFKNTFTLSLLYKKIIKGSSLVPMQFTAVFTFNDLFNVKGLVFSGFADFWFEDNYYTIGNDVVKTQVVFLSEPQLWYNLGQWFKCPNLYLGGEVEISYNFTGNVKKNRGWEFNPAVGIKWNF